MGNTHASWRRHLGLSVHIRDKTVEDIAAIARDSGVPYLEIVAERFWDLPDGGGEIRWQEIKNLLIRYKLRPIVHSSYIDLNMASLNRLLREAAVQQNLRCLEFAAFLEAEHLVVHPGNLNRNYPASLLPEARACLQESLKSLTAQAESLRVWRESTSTTMEGRRMSTSPWARGQSTRPTFNAALRLEFRWS
jgi:sugar phosphate isomerase/epimerase